MRRSQNSVAADVSRRKAHRNQRELTSAAAFREVFVAKSKGLPLWTRDQPLINKLKRDAIPHTPG